MRLHSINLKTRKRKLKVLIKIFKVYDHVSIKIVSISVGFNFCIDIS